MFVSFSEVTYLCCPENRNFCVMIMELNKTLETNEHIVGNSWDICSMVAPMFYVGIVVLYGDVVNSIFHIIPIIFVKGFPKDLFDVLEFISTGPNWIEYPQWWVQDTNISLWSKQYFLVLKSLETSYTYFGVGLKPPKLLYTINWDTWSCLVLLDTMVCVRLYLVLGHWFHRRQGSWNVA